jgi:hypothetical protein
VPPHQLHLHFPRQGSYSIILWDSLDSMCLDTFIIVRSVRKKFLNCPQDKFIKLWKGYMFRAYVYCREINWKYHWPVFFLEDFIDRLLLADFFVVGFN